MNYKLNIFIPKVAQKEVNYAFDVLLKYCLGINDYLVFPSDGQDFLIVQEGKQIVIKNHFFDHDDFDKLYVLDKLPELNEAAGENYAPLYGSRDIKISDHKATIEGDIISSTFLLVSQWEQLVIHHRDEHGRFQKQDSTLGRLGLLQRPLVNEYAGVLYDTMINIGMNVEKTNWFQPVISCDVDQIYKWKSTRNLLGAIKTNYLNFGELYDQISSYFGSKKDRTKDKYYTFDYLISKTKAAGLSSIFFMKTGISNPQYDQNDYEITGIRRLLKEFEEKKVEIGIHPSYESMTDESIMTYEIDQLSNAIKKQVLFSRQHFLRYNITSTWKLLEKNGIKFDSSIQYTEGLGFAGGCCTAYPLFDLPKRRQLDVMEIPLIIMKKQDQEISNAEFLKQAKQLIAETKKHNGHFMLLFHNSDVETREGKRVFEVVVQELIS